MGVRYEDQCVGCPTWMGCAGESCQYMNVPIYFCDRCGDEVEDLYETSSGDFCISCAKNELDDIDLEDAVRNTFRRVEY